MTFVRRWLRLVLIGLATMLFFALWVAGRTLLAGRSALRARWRGFNFASWSRTVLWLMNVEVEVVGTPPKPPFMLVSNHLSYLDIVVLASVLPAVFVSKREVGAWPLLGFIVREVDTIFIDRAARRDIPRAVERIERTLAAGEGVVMFPEGTSTQGAEVARFRPSLLEPAASGGIPVSAAALGYRTYSERTPARSKVCWWGEMTFPDHFLDMLAIPGFAARIAFGREAVRDADRKRLANSLEQRVRELFVPVAGAAAG